MNYYWGLDPGNTGAIAVIAADKIIYVENLPLLTVKRGKRDADMLDRASLAHMMRDLLQAYPPTMATIEHVWANGSNGAIANFVMGGTSYAFEMGCMFLGIRHQLVAPTAWKPTFKLRSGAEKDESIPVVQRLYPSTCELLAPWHKAQNRRNKPNHDRADAVLLATYGFQKDEARLAA
jgi:Holliday junction resolvasome RuvABC endonuclease subunit